MGFAASSLVSVMSLGTSAAWRPRPVQRWIAPLAGWIARRAPASRMAETAVRTEPTSTADVVLTPAAQRPALRVLKVVDGTPRQCAGRMVISGRMADVCAELDRLVAREAQCTAEPRTRSN